MLELALSALFAVGGVAAVTVNADSLIRGIRKYRALMRELDRDA